MTDLAKAQEPGQQRDLDLLTETVLAVLKTPFEPDARPDADRAPTLVALVGEQTVVLALELPMSTEREIVLLTCGVVPHILRSLQARAAALVFAGEVRPFDASLAEAPREALVAVCCEQSGHGRILMAPLRRSPDAPPVVEAPVVHQEEGHLPGRLAEAMRAGIGVYDQDRVTSSLQLTEGHIEVALFVAHAGVSGEQLAQAARLAEPARFWIFEPAMCLVLLDGAEQRASAHARLSEVAIAVPADVYPYVVSSVLTKAATLGPLEDAGVEAAELELCIEQLGLAPLQSVEG